MHAAPRPLPPWPHVAASRDAFFTVIRQASGPAAVHYQQQQQATRSAQQQQHSGGGGSGGAAPSRQQAASLEVLCALRTPCCDVLQQLHPDNLPFLADLYTSCVLQVGRAWAQGRAHPVMWKGHSFSVRV